MIVDEEVGADVDEDMTVVDVDELASGGSLLVLGDMMGCDEEDIGTTVDVGALAISDVDADAGIALDVVDAGAEVVDMLSTADVVVLEGMVSLNVGDIGLQEE
jgi:hypothetical protein